MNTHPEFTTSIIKLGSFINISGAPSGVYLVSGRKKFIMTTRGPVVIVRVGGGYYTLEVKNIFYNYKTKDL